MQAIGNIYRFDHWLIYINLTENLFLWSWDDEFRWPVLPVAATLRRRLGFWDTWGSMIATGLIPFALTFTIRFTST